MMKMNRIEMKKKIINLINDNHDLNLTLEDNEMIVINCFLNNIDNLNISVTQKNNSKLVLNYSGFVKSNATVNYNGVILGNNNECIINMRVIAESAEGNFNVVVKAAENTINNEVIENLKGINEDGTITFIPVLEVDTNMVEASHFATIGPLDKNQIFYLQSKGVSIKSACKLLKKSFLNSLFSEEFISSLNKGKEYNE